MRTGAGAGAVHRDARARAARRHVMFGLLLVANNLDVAIARQKARLVAAEDKVRHDLAERLAARREPRILLTEECKGAIDGLPERSAQVRCRYQGWW